MASHVRTLLLSATLTLQAVGKRALPSPEPVGVAPLEEADMRAQFFPDFLPGFGSEEDDANIDKCVEDNKKGVEECVLWSDPGRGRLGLKTGDVLFFSDEKVKSKLQRLFSGKNVTHVGVVVWNLWDESQGRYHYVPAWQEGAVLSLMEVSNHPNHDIESGIFNDGFQNGDFYHKMQRQPPSTRIYIKPLKAPLDAEKLRTLSTIAGCLHARRPEYVKWVARSETTIGKFYSAWQKSTTEEEEIFERMFCSQFAALVISSWSGPLMMGGKDDKIPVPATPGKDGKAWVLLPGDFDPGDVKNIDNGMFGELYQLQLPYPWVPDYAAENSSQTHLMQKTRTRDTGSFAQQCKAGINDIGYVTRFLPTWAGKMMNVTNELTCFYKCGVGHAEPFFHAKMFLNGTVPLNFTLPTFSRAGKCPAACTVVEQTRRDYDCAISKLGHNVAQFESAYGNTYHLCCTKFIKCTPAAM